MLYSIGKDSSVMLHLAHEGVLSRRKPPFPLLHVDTTWKFREMIRVPRRARRSELGLELLVHINPEALAQGINPFDHGSAVHTDMMEDRRALKQALDKYGFDAAFGGARRDEEKIARQGAHLLVPHRASTAGTRRRQRPELWQLYNARKHKGEIDPRVPAVELDRARHLAIHPPREHPDRAALLRRASARWSSATAR